jgi:hypothetical protein
MKTHQTKLIDGQFSPDNARTILLELINNKISFHRKSKFSNEVRFGTDPDQADNRIAQLEQEKEQLIQWLDTIDPSTTIRISCDIAMENT